MRVGMSKGRMSSLAVTWARSIFQTSNVSINYQYAVVVVTSHKLAHTNFLRTGSHLSVHSIFSIAITWIMPHCQIAGTKCVVATLI